MKFAQIQGMVAAKMRPEIIIGTPPGGGGGTGGNSNLPVGIFFLATGSPTITTEVCQPLRGAPATSGYYTCCGMPKISYGTQQIKLRVVDANGNGVSGYIVSVSGTSSSGITTDQSQYVTDSGGYIYPMLSNRRTPTNCGTESIGVLTLAPYVISATFVVTFTVDGTSPSLNTGVGVNAQTVYNYKPGPYNPIYGISCGSC